MLTHAFLPQNTYEGETAIASQPFVSKASLDGMEVTATAIACGPEFLHEFWFQLPSSRAPVALWILGYDKTYTAAQWYERYWSSIQLNLDEGTDACLHMPVLIRVPGHPFAKMCWRSYQPAWTIGPSQTWRVNGGHWAYVPSTADAIACDVGYFEFCGLEKSKHRPKPTSRLYARLASHPVERVASYAPAWGQSGHQTCGSLRVGRSCQVSQEQC